MSAAHDNSGDRRIRAVISDFGGVLTNHLIEAFGAFQDHTGISSEQLSRAMDDLDHRIRRELPFVADVFIDVTAYRADENSRKGKGSTRKS